MYPNDLRYSNEHEWVRVEADGLAIVGVSHYAQEKLGDVVYIEMPPVGDGYAQFAQFGEIESVKAVNDLFIPVSGEVVEVNAALKDHPELVNKDPYGEGWLVKVRLTSEAELGLLMDASAYERFVNE